MEKQEEKRYEPRLLTEYRKRVLPELVKKLGYKNVNEVPQLRKIVVNVGFGEAISNAKLLDAVMEDLAVITGQKAVKRRAKRSVSNFKLRAGVPVGCKITIRGKKMYDFFDRLVNTAIPRIRDFRGLSPDSFDGKGNYNFGVTEQTIFPEIDYDKIKVVFGMDFAIVTTARNDEEARIFLSEFGFPFKKQ
ncbi:50S ribosomal protein L5 [candidate division WOR-3 bacterium]|nr:50S ribosomal protein L5 [candidate division WOR-3 bacterium]MCK4575225.1 50S ribosomal protein L5 [candidate division WOR-3 bacterium]